MELRKEHLSYKLAPIVLEGAKQAGRDRITNKYQLSYGPCLLHYQPARELCLLVQS